MKLPVRERAEASRRADNPALPGDLPSINIAAAELARDLDAERAGR